MRVLDVAEEEGRFNVEATTTLSFLEVVCISLFVPASYLAPKGFSPEKRSSTGSGCDVCGRIIYKDNTIFLQWLPCIEPPRNRG